MPITNGYATLAELKSRLDITNAALDAVLEDVITAASRQIDDLTGRFFYTVTAAYPVTAQYADLLIPPYDLSWIGDVRTDDDADGAYETMWDPADYRLYRLSPLRPDIVVRAMRARRFPTRLLAVNVYGTWGYGSVPPEVKEACLILAARLLKRRDTPFGFAGAPEIGELRLLTAIDPDVKTLLGPYVKRSVVAI